MAEDLDDDDMEESLSEGSSSSRAPLTRARGGRYEAVLRAAEARKTPPRGVSAKKWLSNPANLAWASKRRMVSKIANKANPASKDTANVFTIGGKRYALTDLYRSPIRERVSDFKSRGKARSLDWWDANSKIVIVAAVAGVAGFMFYSSWKNAQLQSEVAKSRALPAHRMMPMPKPGKVSPLQAHPLPAHQASGLGSAWRNDWSDVYPWAAHTSSSYGYAPFGYSWW